MTSPESAPLARRRHRTEASVKRTREYRRAISQARRDGVPEATIARVLVGLGPNPDADVLRAALAKATHEQDIDPRAFPAAGVDVVPGDIAA